MHFLDMWLNLSVQSTNKSFEMPENLGQYSDEDFFGLFWGEQQPFVSSGYGGLYFFGVICRPGTRRRARLDYPRSAAFPRPRDKADFGRARLPCGPMILTKPQVHSIPAL
jgi:hypothetical protein